MASTRNIQATNAGVYWEVTFEYSNDQQTDPWQTFTARFPRDFDELPSEELQGLFLDLGLKVAMAQGVI